MDGTDARRRRGGDGAGALPSPIDALREAGRGALAHSLLARAGDDETRAICAAMTELAREGRVYRSTSRLDLAIRETALARGPSVSRLARVRQVRGAWHRAGGVRIDVGGVTLVTPCRGAAG